VVVFCVARPSRVVLQAYVRCVCAGHRECEGCTAFDMLCQGGQNGCVIHALVEIRRGRLHTKPSEHAQLDVNSAHTFPFRGRGHRRHALI